jgi:hypothetical protein
VDGAFLWIQPALLFLLHTVDFSSTLVRGVPYVLIAQSRAEAVTTLGKIAVYGLSLAPFVGVLSASAAAGHATNVVFATLLHAIATQMWPVIQGLVSQLAGVLGSLVAAAAAAAATTTTTTRSSAEENSSNQDRGRESEPPKGFSAQDERLTSLSSESKRVANKPSPPPSEASFASKSFTRGSSLDRQKEDGRTYSSSSSIGLEVDARCDAWASPGRFIQEEDEEVVDEEDNPQNTKRKDSSKSQSVLAASRRQRMAEKKHLRRNSGSKNTTAADGGETQGVYLV